MSIFLLPTASAFCIWNPLLAFIKESNLVYYGTKKRGLVAIFWPHPQNSKGSQYRHNMCMYCWIEKSSYHSVKDRIKTIKRVGNCKQKQHCYSPLKLIHLIF